MNQGIESFEVDKTGFGWIMKADKGNTSNGYATLELRDSPNLVGGAVLLFL